MLDRDGMMKMLGVGDRSSSSWLAGDDALLLLVACRRRRTAPPRGLQPCIEIEAAMKSKPKVKQSKAAAPSSSAKMKQPVVVVVEDNEESAMESTETAEKVSEYRNKTPRKGKKDPVSYEQSLRLVHCLRRQPQNPDFTIESARNGGWCAQPSVLKQKTYWDSFLGRKALVFESISTS
ncbi:hypothetical protein ACLB2K_032431 [Fragaria x ananassa]